MIVLASNFNDWTTMKNEVEIELQKVTGIKPKADEPKQAYYRRVANAYFGLSDAAVDGLSEPAYKWCEDAAHAVKVKGTIPNFDFTVDSDEEETVAPKRSRSTPAPEPVAEAEDSEEEAEEESEEHDDIPEPEVQEAPAPAPAQSTKKIRGVRPKVMREDGTVTDRHGSLREAFLRKPSMTRQECIAKGMELGLTESSSGMVYYHVSRVMKSMMDIYGIDIASLVPVDDVVPAKAKHLVESGVVEEVGASKKRSRSSV